MNTNGLDYRAVTATKGPPYGAQQAAGANAERILLLDGAISHITEAAEKAAVLTNRVCELADSIYGSIPQPAETSGKAVSGYGGRAGGLDYAITNLHAQLVELESQIERIRGL